MFLCLYRLRETPNERFRDVISGGNLRIWMTFAHKALNVGDGQASTVIGGEWPLIFHLDLLGRQDAAFQGIADIERNLFP